MNFSYQNDELWTITLSEEELLAYHSPSLANGTIGIRPAPTVFGQIDEAAAGKYTCLSKEIFDGGQQLVLPCFYALELQLDGISYGLKTGKHTVSQKLDLRTGLIRLDDCWEYKPGKKAELSAELLVSMTDSRLAAFRLNIKDAPENSSVRFGLTAPQKFRKNCTAMTYEDKDGLLDALYHTKEEKLPVLQKLFWNASSCLSGQTKLLGEGIYKILTFSDSLSLNLFEKIGPADQMPVNRAPASFDVLIEANRLRWKQLWDHALVFEAGGDLFAKQVLTYQFYLFQSLGGEPQPTGCLGLTEPGWDGCQLWDADLWMFRGVLPLNPSLVLPVLKFRYRTLNAAIRNAVIHRLHGAWYPWKADNHGQIFNVPDVYLHELHNNIWIARAAYEYYLQTDDIDTLREIGFPIISAVADFFCSWAKRGNDGKLHMHDIIGPDELLAEVWGITVSDHFMTSVGVKSVAEIALASAQLLGRAPKSAWKELAEDLYVPEADDDGIFPEYEGYKGQPIKQADAILAFYPLGKTCPPEQCIRNVEYYHGRVDAGGPLMNCQMEAILEMKYADKDAGLKKLMERYNEYVRGSYFIPYETRQNDVSIMLTGIGGLLQSLIFGYYGYEIGQKRNFPIVADRQ